LKVEKVFWTWTEIYDVISDSHKQIYIYAYKIIYNIFIVIQREVTTVQNFLFE
jgi:hypothetical protein